jgi:peptidoglycan/LPS O-acetylase OafA/YrhL
MTPSIDSRPHYAALDGIRGAAAFTVMIGHSAYLYIDSSNISGISGIFLTQLVHLGHPSVVLFFVLSGFVLYISFGRTGSLFSTYIIRRIFRIYPALFAALLVAFILHFVQNPTYKIGLGAAANAHWIFSQDAIGFLRHLLLLGFYDSDVQLNPVIWSLVIELRFSIIFLILAIVARRSALALLILSLLSWAIGRYMIYKLGVSAPYQIGGSALGSLALTLFYLPGFCFGIAAASFLGNRRIDSLFQLHDGLKVGICLMALLVAKLSKDDLLWSAAFAIVILTAAGPGFIQRIFTLKPVLFLGGISYSLYLIHSPILLTMVHVLHGSVPIWVAVVLSPCISIAVAWFLYLLVEKPGMALGKRAANLWVKRDTGMPPGVR